MPEPRKLNPAISPRTERAILWAMELHPNDRPATAEDLRQYLIGTRELPPRPLGTDPPAEFAIPTHKRETGAGFDSGYRLVC